MKDDGLKPCPFCGGDAQMDRVASVDGHTNAGGMFVECRSCQASSRLIFPCGDEPAPLLAEAWNRRAAAPLPGELPALPEPGINNVSDLENEDWHGYTADQMHAHAHATAIAAVTAALSAAQPAQPGKPLFWYRPRSDGGYEGPISDFVLEEVRKRSGAWVPLIAAPAQSATPVAWIDSRIQGPPQGWTITRLETRPFRTIELKAPNGWSTIVGHHERNPSNILYMLADALLTQSTAQTAAAALAALTDDQRMELFGEYCTHCGTPDPLCQCWNDE